MLLISGSFQLLHNLWIYFTWVIFKVCKKSWSQCSASSCTSCSRYYNTY